MKICYILIAITLIDLVLNKEIDLNSGVSSTQKLYKESEYYFYVAAESDQDINVELSMTYVDSDPFYKSAIIECQSRTCSNPYSEDSLYFSSSKEGTILYLNGKHEVFDIFTKYICVKLIPNYNMDLKITITISGKSTQEEVNQAFSYVYYAVISLICFCIIIIVLIILCNCFCCNPKPRPLPSQPMTPLQPQYAQPQYFPPQQVPSGPFYG